jgi:hypothetical protein
MRLHTFGCRAFALVPPSKRKKWDRKATPAIHLGAENDGSYKLLNEATMQIFISSDVTFVDNEFPCADHKNKKESPQSIPELTTQGGDQTTVMHQSEGEIGDMQPMTPPSTPPMTTSSPSQSTPSHTPSSSPTIDPPLQRRKSTSAFNRSVQQLNVKPTKRVPRPTEHACNLKMFQPDESVSILLHHNEFIFVTQEVRHSYHVH